MGSNKHRRTPAGGPGARVFCPQKHQLIAKVSTSYQHHDIPRTIFSDRRSKHNSCKTTFFDQLPEPRHNQDNFSPTEDATHLLQDNFNYFGFGHSFAKSKSSPPMGYFFWVDIKNPIPPVAYFFGEKDSSPPVEYFLFWGEI